MPILRTGTRGRDVFAATSAAETFDGSWNYDKVTYESSSAGILIDLVDLTRNTGDAEGDSYIGIESYVLSMHADTFLGSATKDTVNGRNGNDWLNGGSGDDIVLGDYGRDTLEGGDGNDGIWGGSLEDLISGGAGNDALFGDSFNDTIDGGAGNDSMDGGTGIDLATYATASAGVTVSLALTGVQATGGSGSDRLRNFENLAGSGLDDRLSGNAGANVISGGAGNDTLAGGGGADTLDGGEGIDSVSFAISNVGVTVTLADGGSQALGIMQLVSIEGVEGSSRNDTITGSGADNIIAGGGDTGTVQMLPVTERFYRYSADILIPIAQIDDIGEWVVVPKRHNVENAGALTSINRADGDAILVVTNGFNDARDWNASIAGRPGFAIDLGPGGEIGADTSIIFNAGSGPVTVLFNLASTEGGYPGPKAAGSNANGAVDIVTSYSLGTVTAGDVLAGGDGADTFVYRTGDGVDRLTDFVKGVDRIDVADTWFDGNAANGEAVATAYSGGILIQFSDTSADGVVDNAAILIDALSIGDYDTSIFV
jgi:Ca2+-binding RTX toxin-like protein